MEMKLTKKDYIWSYIGVFLSLFGSIIMTPFVVYFLDGERYGLWGVFQSLAAITVLFDFGFATTFSRNINYCWNGAKELNKTGSTFSDQKEPNFFLMKKTMAACQRVFLLIATVAWVLMITIGTYYILHISRGFQSSEPLIAWIICTIAIFMSLYFGYYGSFLRGVGAISDVYKATVFAKALHIFLTIVLLACGTGIIGTSIAYLSYGTLYRIIAKRRFYRYKGLGEGLQAVKEEISISDIKDTFFIVWHNAWREGLVSLANYLSNQACTIIISLYMPLTQTGAYSLGVHLATAVSQVAAVMYSSNQPVLQSAYVTKDNQKMKKTMALIVFSFVVLDLAGLTAVVTVGLPLLRLIRPETVVAPSIMIGIGLYQLILKFRNCYTSYFSCTNRIIYVKAFLISSIACVIFAILSMGVLKQGVWGLIAAQLISQLMYNAWAWTVKAHKEMKLSAKETVCLGYSESLDLLKSFLHIGRKNYA